MELRDYLAMVRKAWLTIVVTALVTFAGVSALMLVTTPIYSAQTRLFFAVQGAESATDLAQGSTFTAKQMSSYAQVATSPLVLDGVISELRLNETPVGLAKTIDARATADTVILEVTVSGADPVQATAIANSVARRVSDVAGDLSPERQDGTDAVKATILTPAVIPTEPSSPKIIRNLALGLALGLLIGLGIALLRKTLDNKIRSDEDVRAITDLAVLGTIAFNADMDRNRVIADNDPLGYEAEAIRRLRTNLQFVRPPDRAFSVVVTSSVPGEGKSTTSINLAIALADAGSRTLLIDADLRRPSVAEYLGLEGNAGLTTVLIGRANAEDVIQTWHGGLLDVMPAGQIPPNPSELLGSDPMAGLMKDLTNRYDVVILDSSPLLPVTDAAVLSSVVDGVLVIVGVDTHRPQLRESLDSLHAAGGHAFGVVLNKVVRTRSSRYAYNYGYGSYKPLEAPAESNAPVPEARKLEKAK